MMFDQVTTNSKPTRPFQEVNLGLRYFGSKLLKIASILSSLIDLKSVFRTVLFIYTPLLPTLLDRVKLSLNLSFSDSELL